MFLLIGAVSVSFKGLYPGTMIAICFAFIGLLSSEAQEKMVGRDFKLEVSAGIRDKMDKLIKGVGIQADEYSKKFTQGINLFEENND